MTGNFFYFLLKNEKFKDKRRRKEEKVLVCMWRRCTTFRQGLIECAGGLLVKL
jgi:hypothetical protein